MDVPENLFYSKEHEWVRFEGEKAYVGITDYAQHSLGDIVFVELPETDKAISAMDEAGVVESVKAVSPIYCPVTGTICEVNSELETSPELVNSSPYTSYIFVVALSAPAGRTGLLTPAEYTQFCAAEGAES